MLIHVISSSSCYFFIIILLWKDGFLELVKMLTERGRTLTVSAHDRVSTTSFCKAHTGGYHARVGTVCMWVDSDCLLTCIFQWLIFKYICSELFLHFKRRNCLAVLRPYWNNNASTGRFGCKPECHRELQKFNLSHPLAISQNFITYNLIGDNSHASPEDSGCFEGSFSLWRQ